MSLVAMNAAISGMACCWLDKLAALRLEEIVSLLAPVEVADQQVVALRTRPLRRFQRAAAVPQALHQPRRMGLHTRALAACGRLHEEVVITKKITPQVAAQPLHPRMRKIDGLRIAGSTGLEILLAQLGPHAVGETFASTSLVLRMSGQFSLYVIPKTSTLASLIEIGLSNISL